MTDTRLFTGLSLPPEILVKYEELVNELWPLARIRWSPISQLHITTKFIGAIPFGRVSELSRYLYNQPPFPKFSLTLTGIRYMPGRALRSWVLYGKVEPSEPLNQLAAATEESLDLYRVPRDTREFLPHVTIATIPGQNPWPELDKKVEEYGQRPFGTFDVNEYHLYESTSSGYRIFSSIPLT